MPGAGNADIPSRDDLADPVHGHRPRSFEDDIDLLVAGMEMLSDGGSRGKDVIVDECNPQSRIVMRCQVLGAGHGSPPAVAVGDITLACRRTVDDHRIFPFMIVRDIGAEESVNSKWARDE